MRKVLIGDIPVSIGSDIVMNDYAVVSDEARDELVARRLAKDIGEAEVELKVRSQDPQPITDPNPVGAQSKGNGKKGGKNE